MAKLETKADCERSGQRWKAKLALLTLIFLLHTVPSATAGVVTYTLVGVTFSDRGTATGYVIVDYSHSPAAIVGYKVNVVDPAYPVWSKNWICLNLMMVAG